MNKSLLWNKDEPIIQSLLEVDVYKFFMLYFIWKFYPNLSVKFSFTNRTKNVRLTDYVSLEAMREEFNHVRTLRMLEDSIAHLRSLGVFPETFLVWLRGLALPEITVRANMSQGAYVSGEYVIEVSGNWAMVSLWETIVLSVVNELYFRRAVHLSGKPQSYFYDEGNRRLSSKIARLHDNPDVTFLQFGLRRRATRLWERYISQRILTEAPESMLGISNVSLARELGVMAQGTNAHEIPMALYALARHSSDAMARQSPYRVLTQWQEIYGQQQRIILPDTFGTDAFLKGMSFEQAREWSGFRQDSGDPIIFGEKIISFYREHAIDSKEKRIIFSDGLVMEKMLDLLEQFSTRIQVGFGWGTNLTNDLGVRPLSIVMKLTEAAGNPAVKLSDNLNKAVGTPKEIANATRIFGYNNTFKEECVY